MQNQMQKPISSPTQNDVAAQRSSSSPDDKTRATEKAQELCRTMDKITPISLNNRFDSLEDCADSCSS
ncbi:unnamed protein product [Cochlearia groenlandica]